MLVRIGAPKKKNSMLIFQPRNMDRVFCTGVFWALACGVGYTLLGMFDAWFNKDDLLLFFWFFALFAAGAVFALLLAREAFSWFSTEAALILHSDFLRLGDKVKLDWKLQGDLSRVEIFTVYLAGYESYEKNGKALRRNFFGSEVLSFRGNVFDSQGEATLSIPIDAMHSFEKEAEGVLKRYRKYSILWELGVYCINRGRLNSIQVYPIEIHPL